MATPCQPFWPLMRRYGSPASTKAADRELTLAALDLLQAQHVRRVIGDEALHLRLSAGARS